MDSQKPVREMERLVLRVPDALRERLKSRALAKGTSANAEAVSILADVLTHTDEWRLLNFQADLVNNERMIARTLAELEHLRARQDALNREIAHITDSRPKTALRPDLFAGSPAQAPDNLGEDRDINRYGPGER